MLLLPIPTIELVKAECAAFDEENQLAEHALDQLRTHFPLNTDKSHVLLKVLTLNKLYSTRINDKDIEATARHIAALGIDSLLDQGPIQPSISLRISPICGDVIRSQQSSVAGTIRQPSPSMTDMWICAYGPTGNKRIKRFDLRLHTSIARIFGITAD